MRKNANILVDSDAFVALSKKDDTGHKKANALLERLLQKPVVFSTSNYVFSETVTVISQHLGRKQAALFIRELKAAESIFSVYWIDDEIESLAIEIFYNQTSKNVSFVDCTNMAILKKFNVDAIFSFDSIYKRNGFILVEDLRL